MASVLYLVLVKAQLGNDATMSAVYEEGAIVSLEESIGDACPYVERLNSQHDDAADRASVAREAKKHR